MEYTCLHCRKKLNTETDEFVLVGKRHAHKSCREKFESKKTLPKEKKEKDKEKSTEKKTPLKYIKKCYYCGKDVDTLKEDYRKPKTNRYAHTDCYNKNYTPDENYVEAIYSLLKDVGIHYDYTQCERQRLNFIKKMGYTNEGIFLTLKFFYLVEKADTAKAENRIGIVPYKYDEAQRYFSSLEQKQKQIGEAIKKQLEKEHKVIVIETPYQKKSRRKYIDLDTIGGE